MENQQVRVKIGTELQSLFPIPGMADNFKTFLIGE